MVDNSPITQRSRKPKKRIDNTTNKDKPQIEPIRAPQQMIIPEEKVEVLIKEIIRINPRDFSAFKHALEEFVESWDK